MSNVNEDAFDELTGLTGKPKSTVNMDAFEELTGKEIDNNSPRLTSTNPWSQMDTRTANKVFDKVYNPVQSPFIDLEEQAAQNQGGWEILGNAIGQGVSEVVLGTLSGIGQLLDVPQYGSIAQDIANMSNEEYTKAETEYTNWFSSMMDQAKESLQEDTFGILQTKDAKEGFAPWDATWWGSNAKSVATTLSLMVPAAGAVGLLGKAGKMLGAGSKFMRTVSSQNIAKGVTGALVSRYMENTMEASQTFEEIKQKALERGHSEAEAEQMAAKGAATAWRLNTAALATDLPQYLMGFGAFKGIANKGMNKSLTKEILKTVGLDMPSEALEESYQHMINAEATAKGLGDIDKAFGKGFGERFQEYVSDPHLWTSAWFGALGGGVFSMANSPMRTLASKFGKHKPEDEILNFTQQFIGKVRDNEYASEAAQDNGFIGRLIKSAEMGRLDQFKELINAQASENEDMAKYPGYFEEFERNYELVKNDGTLSNEQKINKVAWQTAETIYKDKLAKFDGEINGILNEIEGLSSKDKDVIKAYHRLSAYKKLKENLIKTGKAPKETLDKIEKEIRAIEASKEVTANNRPRTSKDDQLRGLYLKQVDSASYLKIIIQDTIDELSKNSPDSRSKKIKSEEAIKLDAAEKFTTQEEFTAMKSELSPEGRRELTKIWNKKVKEQKKEAGKLNLNNAGSLLNRYKNREILLQEELNNYNKKFGTSFTTANEMAEHAANKDSIDQLNKLEKRGQKIVKQLDKALEQDKKIREGFVSDEEVFADIDSKIESNNKSIKAIRSKYKGNEKISKEDQDKIDELRKDTKELRKERKNYNKNKSKEEEREEIRYKTAKKIVDRIKDKDNLTKVQKKAKEIVDRYEASVEQKKKVKKSHSRISNLYDHLQQLTRRVNDIKKTLKYINTPVMIQEDGTITESESYFSADPTRQTDSEFIEEVIEKYKKDISYMSTAVLKEEEQEVQEIINRVTKEGVDLAQKTNPVEITQGPNKGKTIYLGASQEERRQLGVVYLIAKQRLQAVQDEIFKREDNFHVEDLLAEHTERELRERKAKEDPYLVELDENDNFIINGEFYKNLFENPLDALFVDKNGKEKVILHDKNGKKVYFDDEIIVDQVYYLILLDYKVRSTSIRPAPTHVNEVTSEFNKKRIDKEGLFKNSEEYELETDLQEIIELLRMTNNVIEQERTKLREGGLSKKDTEDLLKTMDEWEHAKDLRRLKKMAENRISKLTKERKVKRDGTPNKTAAKTAFKSSKKASKRKKSKRKNSNLKELQQDLRDTILAIEEAYSQVEDIEGYQNDVLEAVKREKEKNEKETTQGRKEVQTSKVEAERKKEEVKETISEDIFNEFVNTGKVSDTILESIAKKVKQNSPLSKREQAIFNDNVSKIENILKKDFEEDPFLDEETGEYSFVKIEDIVEEAKEVDEALDKEIKKSELEEQEESEEILDEEPEIEQYEPNFESREEEYEQLVNEPVEEENTPSLLIMHDKKMKTMTSESGQTYWIPDEDEVGVVERDGRNDGGIDWNYVNGRNIKKGDKLNIEIDTSNQWERNGFAGRVILITKYLDGNTSNKDQSNRKVVGMVKAYKDKKYPDNKLFEFRKRIDELLGNRIGNIVLDETITVDEVKPGWVQFDGKVKELTELNENPTLMVVKKTKEGSLVPVVPKGVTLMQNSSSFINKGGVYVLVPMADGTHRPVRLFTRKVKDVPAVKDKIMQLLKSANENNWKDKKDELKKYIWHPNLKDFSYTAGKGFNVKDINDKLQTGLTAERLYEVLFLDEQVVHTPAKALVEQSGKNFTNRFLTNIDPVSPIHSVKIGLDFDSLGKEDTQTEEGSDNLLDEWAEEGGDNMFSLATTPTPEIWNEEQEVAWFKKKFPNVPIEVLENLYQIHGTGKKAWGVFKNASVYIASDAAKGTTYHEAFHVVFNMFSTPKQKEKLLSLAEEGTTELEKEEWLAERFKEYQLAQEENPTLAKEIRNFIKNLWLMIKNIFTDLSLEETFHRMSRKTYSSQIKGSHKYEPKYSIDMSAKEVDTGVRMINQILFNNFLPDFRKKFPLLSDNEIFDRLGTEKIYKAVVSKIRNGANSPKTPKETKEYVDKFLDMLVDSAGNLKTDLYTRIKSGVSMFGFTFKQNVGFDAVTGSEEATLNLEEDQNFYESWQRTHMSVSNKDRLSQKIKQYLASIPKITKRDGKYAKARNAFGMTDWHNPSFIYNFLITNLSDTYDSEKMKKKVAELAKVKPELGIIYRDLIGDNSLRKRMGLPDAIISGQELVTHMFTQIAAKAHAEFIMTTQNTYWTGQEFNRSFVNELKVFTSNRSTIKNVLIEDFRTTVSSNPIPNIPDQSVVLETGTAEEIKNFLDQVGIFVTLEEAETITKLEAANKQTMSSSIRVLIEQANAGKDIFIEEGSNLDEFFGELRFVKPNLFQLGFKNVEGKIVYSHINPSFTSKQLKSLIENKDWYMSDPLYQDSFLLQELEREKMTFAIMDGYRGKGVKEGLAFDKMDEGTFAKTVIAQWYNEGKSSAYYPHQILSDSPSMVMFKWKKYTVEEVKDRLKKVYEQEKKRIENYKEEYEEFNNYSFNVNDYLLLPFMNDYTPDQNLDEFLDQQLNRYVENEIKYLVELGLLERDGKMIKDSAKNFHTGFKSDITDNLRKYLLNDLLMQTQIVSLFSGDPAFYKKDKKPAIEKVNGKDVNRKTVAESFYKRNKQTWSPGILLDVHAKWGDYTPSAEFKVGVYEDIDIPTELNGEEFTKVLERQLKKAGVSQSLIDDILPKYETSSLTDAQGFIDIVRLRDIEIMAGRWSNKKEDIYQRMIKGEVISESVFNTFKPFYFSHIKEQGKIIPTQFKNSEALLIPHTAAKNPTMKKMMEAMGWEFNGNNFKYNEKARKIDSLQSSEAFKVGTRRIQSVQDFEDGVIDWDAQSITLNNSDYRIQVETPLHHIDYNNLLGTQIRKLMMSDLMLDEMYGDKTGKELLDEYEQLMVEDIEESFKKLTEGPDAIFNNRVELINRLREEVIDRGLGNKYIQALDFINTETGETVLPLWHPSHAYRIEALLTSIITNEVIKQKAPGGVLINETAWGWDKQPKIVFKDDGGVDHFEGYVPASFIFGKRIPSKYMTNGEPDINKVLKDPNFDKSLLDIIAYRIPTEDKYSMINVKVTGFTAEAGGGKIILPPEITSIAGLDFDIDKVFAIRKDMEYKDGKYSVKKNNNSRRVEIMKQILSSPHTLESIFNPNEFATLAGFADEFKRADIKAGKRNLALAYASTRWKVFTQMQTGKALVGVFANHNASHATMQFHNVDTIIPIMFDGQARTSLSSTHTYKMEKGKLVKNKRISKVLASYLAASVDNGKDPVLGFLNINSYTADIAAMINRVGYTEETAVYFINQPIIKELTKLYLAKGGGKRAEKEALEEIGKKYGFDVNKLTNDGKAVTFNTKDLKENRQSTKMDKFQQDILKTFLRYKLIANDLGKVIQATRNDAMNTGPTMAHTEAAINSRNNLLKAKKPQLKGVANYLESANTPSLYKFYEKGFLEAYGILGNYMPYANGDFVTLKEHFNEMYLDQIERGINSEEINNINNEFIRFLASKFEPFQEPWKNILKRVNQQKRNDLQIKYPQYDVFFNLVKDFEVDGINIPTMTGTSGLDALDQDYITQMWEEMLNSDIKEITDIAKDLATLSFHTGGFAYSPNGMGHYVPVSYFRNTVDSNGKSLHEFLDALINNGKEVEEYLTDYKQDFSIQYIQNNFNKLAVVPTAVEDIYETTNIEKGFTLLPNAYKGSKLPTFMKIRKGDKVSLYKKNEGRYYSKYPERGIRSKKGNILSEYIFGDSNLITPVAPTYKVEKKETLVDKLVEESKSFETTTINGKSYYINPMIEEGKTWERVSTEVGNEISLGIIQMQPDNIEKIKDGTKTQTIRNEFLADGLYTLPDGSQVLLKKVYDNKITAKDIGNSTEKNKFAQREGFKNWMDFYKNNKFSSAFISGKTSRYVYSIEKPELLESSQVIGNGIDAFVRDFFSGTLRDSYDNLTPAAQTQLKNALTEIKKQVEARGEKIVSSPITVYNNKVAGTMDLLSINPDGTYNIYDVKSKKSGVKYMNSKDYGKSDFNKWTDQLNAYKELFENQTGKKIKKLAILPIKVDYKAGETVTKEAIVLPGIEIPIQSTLSEESFNFEEVSDQEAEAKKKKC